MVAKIATGEVEVPANAKKSVPARRAGGVIGGKVRAERLTPAERKEIAKKAAAARWSK
jgi:hypothetical protein